ncbi:hypothetical protein B1813_16070 [Saccharomonospora piscinae]|uniref:Integral membrane protein n=1 Tax=Saccharomonospora piscinae TaxID=687388 RepID=A0A1V9A248_SACPI|nr:hypothetical protein [Saccharomonospora piscinae]OQO91014.1 hypothetical protein B1813_16070 [Saccharomonospora piscinae]
MTGSVTTAPTAAVPRPVLTASRMWLVAVAAGVFEMVLAVADLLAEGTASPGEIVAGVGVRLVVFAVAVYLVGWLRRGRNWARLTLAAMLGVIGTVTLLINPIQSLLQGHDPVAALAGLTLAEWLFTASRIVHLGAVVAAMVLMFRPAANTYFRRDRQR